MNSYWLTFEGRKPACVEAGDEESAAISGFSLTGAKVLTCKVLPYPALPRLNPYKDPQYGVCPAFCYTPEKCAGFTSCPGSYSCTD